MKTKKLRTILCICTALILISCIGASWIQTAGGKIDITKINIVSDGGAVQSAYLFRPVDATSENPLPAVITSHGNYNNKEMQDSNSIELARRGFVVMSIDMYRHGNSSVTDADKWTYSMIDALKYIGNLDFVDQTKVGITGHSRGAKMCNDAIKEYLISKATGREVNYDISCVLLVGSNPWTDPFVPETANQTTSVTGQNYTLSDELYNLLVDYGEPVELTIDYGQVCATYDEWNFQSPDVGNDPSKYFESDAGRAFINQLEGVNLTGDVESGKFYYGTIGGETYSRVMYQTHEIHPMNHFSLQECNAVVNYFYTELGVPNGHEYIAESSQVWWAKELFNLIGLIGLLMLIYPLGCGLMRLPLFQELAASEKPRKLPALKTVKDKVSYWVCWCIIAAIPPLLLFPIAIDWVGQGLASPSTATPIFGQPNTNELVVWSMCIAVVMVAVFFVKFALVGKPGGITIEDLGIKITAKKFFKALLLGAFVVGILYTIVFAADYFFTTDFRIWVIAVKATTPRHLVLALTYFIGFLIFYLANSMLVNANRIEGWPEWKVLLFSCINNVIGIAIIIAIQYATFVSTGALAFNAMRVVNLFPLVVLIPVASIIQRKYFDKTGNIYLGAIVMALFYSIVTCANTRTDLFWF